MRKRLAGWFGWISAWWARRADRTYPHYSERERIEQLAQQARAHARETDAPRCWVAYRL